MIVVDVFPSFGLIKTLRLMPMLLIGGRCYIFTLSLGINCGSIVANIRMYPPYASVSLLIFSEIDESSLTFPFGESIVFYGCI